MKRTRVDGQLSRLEYEEQEAAASASAPGGGGGHSSAYVRNRSMNGLDWVCGVGWDWMLTNTNHRALTHQGGGYGGGGGGGGGAAMGGGAASFQRATPSTLATRRLVKPRRVDRRREYLEAVKALNTRFQVSTRSA